jgi:hypothetical protein
VINFSSKGRMKEPREESEKGVRERYIYETQYIMEVLK